MEHIQLWLCLQGCIRTVEDVVFEIQYMYVAYSNVLIEVENTDIAREPKSIPGGFKDATLFFDDTVNSVITLLILCVEWQLRSVWLWAVNRYRYVSFFRRLRSVGVVDHAALTWARTHRRAYLVGASCTHHKTSPN